MRKILLSAAIVAATLSQPLHVQEKKKTRPGSVTSNSRATAFCSISTRDKKGMKQILST